MLQLQGIGLLHIALFLWILKLLLSIIKDILEKYYIITGGFIMEHVAACEL